MQKLSQIDPSQTGRSLPRIAERKQQHKQQLRQQQEALYQQLLELCRIGEYEAAKQLARRDERWFYAIVAGEVVANPEPFED